MVKSEYYECKLSPYSDFWKVGSISASGHEDLVTWVGLSAKNSSYGFWREDT